MEKRKYQVVFKAVPSQTITVEIDEKKGEPSCETEAMAVRKARVEWLEKNMLVDTWEINEIC